MPSPTQNNATAILGAFKQVKVTNKINNDIENATSPIANKNGEITPDNILLKYKNWSNSMMKNIIIVQNSTILANKPLLFSNISESTIAKLQQWQKKNNFLIAQISVAEKSTEFGMVFLGFRANPFISDATTIFTAQISNFTIDPLYNFPSKLDYQTDKFSFGDQTMIIYESYKFDYSEKKYKFTRYGQQVDKNGKKVNDQIIENSNLQPRYQIRSLNSETNEYQAVDFIWKKEIDGVIFMNNIRGKSDLDNIKTLADDRATIFYEIGSKLLDLSPKVLYKTIVGGTDSKELQNQWRKNTFIELKTRASQFNSPFVVFDPSRQTQDLKSLIDMYEDEIMYAALCNSPMGSGKKAQENDLGTSLNNQTSGDYFEQKANLYSVLYSQFFRKLGKAINLELDEIEVTVELSTTQQRVIGNPEDENAPEVDKTTFEGDE